MASQAMNKILNFLGLDNKNHKFSEELTGDDGTVYQVDELSEGSAIYCVNPDGTTSPAEEGTIKTDDYTIEVGADGTIDSIEESEDMEGEGAENIGMKKDPQHGSIPASLEGEGDSDIKADTDILSVIKTLATKIDELAKKVEAMQSAEVPDTSTAGEAGFNKVTKEEIFRQIHTTTKTDDKVKLPGGKSVKSYAFGKATDSLTSVKDRGEFLRKNLDALIEVSKQTMKGGKL